MCRRHRPCAGGCDLSDRRDGSDVLSVAQHGGLKGDQVKRLKELETENGPLRPKAVFDLTLDKLILTEARQENL